MKKKNYNIKANQIQDDTLGTIKVDLFHKAMMPIARRNIMKKKKWNFVVDNEWEIYKDWFAVSLLSFNIQKDFICIVIFGFAFIWER